MPIKITLIRPPRMIRAASRSMISSQAIGLAYISSSLLEKGHIVNIIDAIGEASDKTNVFCEDTFTVGLSSEEIIDRIPSDSNVIGFSCMFTQDWLNTKQLIKQVGKSFPNAILIAGGEHITALPEYCIENTLALSVCILGEGEETIADLADAIEYNRPLSQVDGIVYKDDSGIHRNKRRSRVRDIDSLPYPAWGLLPMDKYFANGVYFGVNRGRSLAILATRGCPYECSFCSSVNMWGKRYYMRDVKKVVEEIVYFKNIYNISNVDFFDLTAIISKDWIIAFCKELMDQNIVITWQLPSGTRVEALDEEVAGYLARSGCKNISYAPESGSKETLIRIKKKLSTDILIKSMRSSIKNGLNIKANIIIGLPGDTHRNIWETFWFIVKLSWYGAHDVASTVYTAYPGSEMFDALIKNGQIDLEKDEYFISMLDSDSFFRLPFYNENISKKWLQFYWIFAIFLFYGTSFLFRPGRIYTFISNVIAKRYESRGQMALGQMLQRMKSKPNYNVNYPAGIEVAE